MKAYLRGSTSSKGYRQGKRYEGALMTALCCPTTCLITDSVLQLPAKRWETQSIEIVPNDC